MAIPEWITLSKNEGQNDDIVDIIVAENTGEERQASITVKTAGNVQKVLSIVQKRGIVEPVATFNQTEFNVAETIGDVSIEMRLKSFNTAEILFTEDAASNISELQISYNDGSQTTIILTEQNITPLIPYPVSLSPSMIETIDKGFVIFNINYKENSSGVPRELAFQIIAEPEMGTPYTPVNQNCKITQATKLNINEIFTIPEIVNQFNAFYSFIPLGGEGQVMGTVSIAELKEGIFETIATWDIQNTGMPQLEAGKTYVFYCNTRELQGGTIKYEFTVDDRDTEFTLIKGEYSIYDGESGISLPAFIVTDVGSNKLQLIENVSSATGMTLSYVKGQVDNSKSLGPTTTEIAEAGVSAAISAGGKSTKTTISLG